MYHHSATILPPFYHCCPCSCFISSFFIYTRRVLFTFTLRLFYRSLLLFISLTPPLIPSHSTNNNGQERPRTRSPKVGAG
jgi:hypothetical protein